MGVGVRVHFIDVDGSIKRIPFAKFDRLMEGESQERFEEYAGKRVKCALTFVDLCDRKVVGIRHIDCMIVPFSDDGTLDEKEKRRGDRLGFMSSDLDKLGTPSKVVSLSPKLARKQFFEEFKWILTEAERSAIESDILWRST